MIAANIHPGSLTFGVHHILYFNWYRHTGFCEVNEFSCDVSRMKFSVTPAISCIFLKRKMILWFFYNMFHHFTEQRYRFLRCREWNCGHPADGHGGSGVGPRGVREPGLSLGMASCLRKVQFKGGGAKLFPLPREAFPLEGPITDPDSKRLNRMQRLFVRFHFFPPMTISAMGFRLFLSFLQFVFFCFFCFATAINPPHVKLDFRVFSTKHHPSTMRSEGSYHMNLHEHTIIFIICECSVYVPPPPPPPMPGPDSAKQAERLASGEWPSSGTQGGQPMGANDSPFAFGPF